MAPIYMLYNCHKIKSNFGFNVAFSQREFRDGGLRSLRSFPIYQDIGWGYIFLCRKIPMLRARGEPFTEGADRMRSLDLIHPAILPLKIGLFDF